MAHLVSDAEWNEAHRINALVDAHRDDPQFGYRYLAEEVEQAGCWMATRTAWPLCRTQRLFSVISARSTGKGARPGPPVHDDLVQRDFTDETVNTIWLTDITEHHTSEGKAVSVCVRSTAMLPDLARYMGHATFDSTYYYIHTSPDFMDSYADVVAGSHALLPEVGFE